MTSMKIRAATIADKPAWLALRRRQRPALSDRQHESDWVQMMEQRSQRMTLLAVDEQGGSLGMIEVSRRMHSDWLGPGPVAYVEALHVEPGQDRETTAERLTDAAASWAQARGCRMLASDTSIDNQWEQKLHLDLGFEEVARKVVYRRVLRAPATVLTAAGADQTPRPLPVTNLRPPTVPSDGIDEGPGWWPGPGRAVIILLGVLAIYFTNIFSSNIFFGVLLPIVDVLFAIYLLMLFIGMRYRRKTDSGERQLDLYQVSNDSE